METPCLRWRCGARAAVISLILLEPVPLPAADRTWDGGDPVNQSWSDPDNWNPNGAPAAGDRLIFPSGVVDVATNNNFAAGSSFLGLEFTGDNYSVSGNTLGLGISGLVLNVAGTGEVTVNAGINLNSDQIWNIAAADTLTMGATLDVTSRQLTLSGAGNVVFDGAINGTTGPLVIAGTGNVIFNGAKNFAGPLSINNNGDLTINHSSGLGNLAGSTAIAGVLRLGGGGSLTLAEGLELSGTLTSPAGTHSLTGGINLSAVGLFTVGGGSITTTAVISGSGTLQKNGAGNLVIAGAAANTYGGSTTFFGGLNTLQKPAGVTAVPSSTLNIGNGVGGAVEVRLGNSEQINDNARVDVESNGTFNLNGRMETVASLALEGPAEVEIGAGTLKLGSGTTSLATTAAASVAVVRPGKMELLAAETTWTVADGSGGMDLRVEADVGTALARAGLTKTGTGSMELTGTNTVPLLTVKEGGVFITGDSSGMNCVLDGAGVFLLGDGGVGDITSGPGGGGVLPGVTLGILPCGDVRFNPATTLHVQLSDNAVPGTDYDQLDVTGTVDLGGAALNLSLLLFSADPGDEFVIVRNDGQDPLAGTFAGLPEGSYFNAGGQDFHITYAGLEGNDVVVTHVVPPTGNTRVWSGLSAANSNWTTNANWIGSVSPVPGDRLVFPAGASRLSNINNYPAGTTFHSITIAASGYTLGGNLVLLNEGLTATHGTAALSTIDFPLRPVLDQTFSSTGGLVFEGPIDLDGKVLVLAKSSGNGNMIVNGVVSGQGTLRKRGEGMLFLNAANTYTASTFIEEGILDIQTPTSLGTSLTQVRPAGTLLINSNSSINGPANTLALEGTLISSGSAASHAWLGTVILVGTTPVIQVNTPLTVSGSIFGSANGGFTKTGTGLLRIAGANPNTFTGGLSIHQGVVELAKPAGVVALPGPVTVGDGTGTDTLRLINADQIPDTATLHLNGGVFDTNNLNETVSTLNSAGGTVDGAIPGGIFRIENALTILPGAAMPTVLNGRVRCGNDMTWTIADGPAADELMVNAFLDAGNPLVILRKEGGGRMVLAGNSEIPTIFAAGGTVRVTGAAATQFNLAGGTLDGTGNVGRIIGSAGGGTVAPGLSPGRLTCTQTAWNSPTLLSVELLNSTTAGTTYDQLAVNGPVNLGGAALQVTALPGFSGSIGNTFVIVSNDGTDAVTGTFAGRPEGSVVGVGPLAFTVSYTGGSGNDIVLTRITPPVPPLLAGLAFSAGSGPGGQDVVNIVGTAGAGASVTLQASLDLLIWTDEQTITANGAGLLGFTVFQTPGIPRRFFRPKP